jgi:sulfate adenylyltransferase large subunit
MSIPNLKFVIVGHVDHGKSTLIGRLLYDTNSLPPDKIEEMKQASQEVGREAEFAFLMDHLREEREQGITIDTAQVFFKTAKRQYVIVDAPGHVEFVKNMITGASQAEAGFLIVDTKEGVQEQTKRHAYILSMLGLEQVVVLLNKMDLVSYSQDRFQQIKQDIEHFLISINIKPDTYIPISASKGDNIAKRSENLNWYKGPTVLEALDSFESKVSEGNGLLIFPVQDVYRLEDKRIVVGRVESGTISKGQLIKILPTGQTTKVNSIEVFLKDADKGYTGESIGITTEDAVFLERGTVICEPQNGPYLTDTFQANVFWMAKNDFDKNERIVLRCATQEISCKVETIVERINSSTLEIIEKDAHKLSYLEVGKVSIKTKKPIAIKTFNELQELGRFVFVQNENICAGGIITEVK